MTAVTTAFSLINIAVLILTISLAVIYLSPVLLIRRFHNTNNVYTANICFATICCCSYWLFFYIALEFYPEILSGSRFCLASNYFGMMCTFQVPLAVVGASFSSSLFNCLSCKTFFQKETMGSNMYRHSLGNRFYFFCTTNFIQ